ncbi:MAG: right-handed parallel beta-helix repeat-containing protein, partial [Akkermansiaceae bacterium]
MPSLQHSLFALYQATLILPVFSAEIEAPGRFVNLQAALDSAKAGDTVLVEPGRYDEQLTIPAGVTLQSSGDNKKGKTGLARAEAVVIDSQGKAPAVTLLEGAALDGVTVTGAGTFDQQEFDRHHKERGENLADHHGAVRAEGPSPAVSIQGVTAFVRHCIVRDNGRPGIGVVGPGRAMISNNHIYRNMGGGIGIADGSRAQVFGNRCWKNLRAGIGCRNSSPSIFKNHCFENVRAGIGIREGATPDVSENHCYQNRRAGIGVRMAGTEPRIFKNQCYQNGMAGI